MIFVPDNITPTAYSPGEFYEVPGHIARAMIERGVAVLAVPSEPIAAPDDAAEDAKEAITAPVERTARGRAKQ